MAGVLAEILAPRAEVGERQSTLRRYNAAVRAAKDLGVIGAVVQQLHKRITQAVSKVGCQPYLPLRVCASSWRERNSNLVRCLWLAWQFSAGFFGLGLAKYLASVWGMYHCLCGSAFGIPKLVRKVGSLGHSQHWRIVSERPCFDGRRRKRCERAIICSLGAVLGWHTSSRRSLVRRLGDATGGIIYAGVAALRVTLATPKCSSSSSGNDGVVSALPFNYLGKPGQVGSPDYLQTWRFGPPTCTLRRPSRRL